MHVTSKTIIDNIEDRWLQMQVPWPAKQTRNYEYRYTVVWAMTIQVVIACLESMALII